MGQKSPGIDPFLSIISFHELNKCIVAATADMYYLNVRSNNPTI